MVDKLDVQITWKDSLSPILAALPLKMIGVSAGLAAIAAGVIKATKISEEYETALATVSTLVDTSKVSMDAYRQGILDMSGEVLKSPKELAEGLYQVVSAGIDTSKSLDVLRIAAKAATGGMTDTFTAVDGITSVLNAYNMEAEEAKRVSDVMFTAVRLGKTTFGELSGSIGRALPMANKLGISFEDLMSAVTALTLGGLSTEEAIVALRGTMASIIKPANKSADAAEELGIEWSVAALKSKGLLGMMEELSIAAEGNDEAVAQLVPRIRGYIGTIALASDGAKKLASITDEMTVSVDAAEGAFDKMAATTESSTKKQEIAWENLGIKVGSMMTPLKKEYNLLMAEMVNATTRNLPLIIDVWSQTSIDIWTGIKWPYEKLGQILGNLSVTAPSAIKEMWDKTKIILSAMLADFKILGKEIVGGLIDGIKGAGPAFIASIKGTISNAIKAAKDKLGISSPSLVFAGIGEQMMAGMAMGVNRGADMPSQAVGAAVQNITNNNQSFSINLGGSASNISLEEQFLLEGTLQQLARYGSSISQES